MADPVPSSPNELALQQLVDRAIACHQNGRIDEAERLYRQILKAQPDQFDAQHLLGVIRHQQGRNDEALALLEAALRVNPHSPRALSNHGLVLYVLRRFEDALASLDRSLSLNPDFVEAHNNRGNVLLRLKRFDEALASFERALALAPGFVEAHNNRGNSLQGLKRHEEALASYDRALALRPNYPDALYNRGSALKALDRQAEALASLERAHALRPDHAETLFVRGDALNDLKRYEEAIASYEKAIALRPDHPYAYSGIAESALAICDWTRTAELKRRLETQVAEQTAIVNPFTLLRLSDGPSLHLRCARAFLADKLGGPRAAAWSGKAGSHGKIRIAYLSADFHRHATAHLIAELIELHDRARFEVHGVAFDRDDGSAVRQRLVKAFDRFHDVRTRSDRDIASRMRELEIDIAVDLKGYTKDSRPDIFAWRAAPIQASYLGYPGTMGAAFIDYIIADAVVAPFEHAPFYHEKIVQLPDCYQVNDSKREIAPRAPARAGAGLPERGFVFCCFNNNYKITAPVFDIWMRLLKQVPGSVLWLLRENDAAERNLHREAQARGVDPARLVFAPRLTLGEHLARHRLADLFLDTLPYNAHTTASDALWAGLPVVTCQGEAFAARVAASLLRAVGLPELVTRNAADYEALALRLAADAAALGEFRARLAANRTTRPLFDCDRFRRHIEAAYATMWETRQRGDPPRSFAVAADNSVP
ncbi:MAG: protein O-GlcNAc transferase [Alphaproteobacteria bacterium]|jgi:predicted O-linked N-acetylglucosamine transferase (SPINDLY family)|nr:protein O-GlcNAc transferase [Alphaproteobacteria bacterium]